MAELSDPLGDSFLVFPDEHWRQLGDHWLKEGEFLLLLKRDLSALSNHLLQVR